MIRQLLTPLYRHHHHLSPLSSTTFNPLSLALLNNFQSFSTQSTKTKKDNTTTTTIPARPTIPDAALRAKYAYTHFQPNARHQNQNHSRPKFKIPRKRASSLFQALNDEAVEKSKSSNPAVLSVPFRVGDAIEIEMVSDGGVASSTKKRERIRGVVIGRVNRGLGSSVMIKDVVFGTPIERQIALHSPLLKKLTVLEKNWIYKGKRKVKRAKLYYLRDRLPVLTKVTK